MSEGASDAAGGTSTPRGAAVAFIFVTILLDMMELGVVITVLPKLIESFVNNDTASAARIFGLFGTAWALMQFLFSPIIGGLSDRFGRRPRTRAAGRAQDCGRRFDRVENPCQSQCRQGRA